jgi:predicted DCC family thiol-disulfide oxidoreductase YuxK
VETITQPGIGLRQDQILVVFDGQCGLCNHTVRWLLRRDRRDRLRFAASSDPVVADLLKSHGIPAPTQNSGPDTILVLRNLDTPVEEMLVRSKAILACLRVLPQPWPAFAAILRLIPRPFRESCYALISRWRYRIWGRYDFCPIPTSEERSHFL